MGGSVFTPAELAYLHEGRRLGRIATVGPDGMPHVVPSGWTHNRELDTIDVTGRAVEDTKKYRDVVRSGRAAIVIDDIASVSPFRPRAIEVRGPAEAVREPEALIRIYPQRIVSWGIDDRRLARTVNTIGAPHRFASKAPISEDEESKR
jgi:pyridoxamine 5'-phosphate oxidase family protein